MKKGRRVVVRYSNTYEKALPNRSLSLSLSDAEWDYIEPHMPTAKEHGRPRIHSPREVLNAVFYILRSGCRWRLLPVAPTSSRLPSMAHRLPLLQNLAHRRRLGKDRSRAIRERLRVLARKGILSPVQAYSG